MAEAFDGMDAIVELTGPILFQTEFGISSIHGGQMDLQRASGMSAHAITTLAPQIFEHHGALGECRSITGV
ncbi:hypothetical protein CXF86_08310 [Shewanella sp. GutCb]|nr:hypothetical protein CXF86_08310 [Shewanella sp. GutCb]